MEWNEEVWAEMVDMGGYMNMQLKKIDDVVIVMLRDRSWVSRNYNYIHPSIMCE